MNAVRGMSRAGMAGLAAVVIAAAVFRFTGLGDVSRGFYQDEAEYARSALALLNGDVPPDNPCMPFMVVPLWPVLQLPFLRLLGPTAFAARLPSALASLAAVLLGWWLARKRWGEWGGIAAAGMLGLSLWHLIYGRSAVAVGIIPLQCLLVGVFVLGPVPRRPRLAGALAGIAAAAGLYSYYPAYTLPLALAAVVAVRTAGDRGFRLCARDFALAALAGGLVASAGLLVLDTGPVTAARGIPPLPPGAAAAKALAYVRALFWPWSGADYRPGFWSIYPTGSPLLSVPESLLVLLGVASLADRTVPRWPVAASLVWLCIGLLPAAFAPGTVRSSHPAAMLAPLSLLAGAGAASMARRLPRAGPPAVAVALAVLAVLTGWRYFGMYRVDARTRVWSNVVEVYAGLWLKEQAPDGKVLVALNRDVNPVVDFMTYGERREGRIEFIVAPVPTVAVFETVFREPTGRTPAVFVYRLPGREGPGVKAYLLLGGLGALEPSAVKVRRGDLAGAELDLRKWIGTFPDFGLAHARLADVLARKGDKEGAARERSIAVRLGVEE